MLKIRGKLIQYSLFESIFWRAMNHVNIFRCATMCLLATLCTFYPRWMFFFQLSMTIDISCHWIHLHTSLLQVDIYIIWIYINKTASLVRSMIFIIICFRDRPVISLLMHPEILSCGCIIPLGQSCFACVQEMSYSMLLYTFLISPLAHFTYSI